MPVERSSMMNPGLVREIAISDLPGSDIHGMISDRYKFNPEESAGLRKWISDTALIESEGGTVNPETSARGIFQFLTKGDNNSFQTGLNRLSTAYEILGNDIPDWVASAKKHGDPDSLTEDQQRDLFLGNIFSSIKSPEETERLLKGASRGNLESSVELYMKYHHGSGGKKKERDSARKRATSIYGGNYNRGGLVRDSYGRTLF